MIRPAPANARSLETRVQNLCRALGIAEGRVRRLIGVTVLGQILQQAGIGPVKGATNLQVRLGTARTRISSDLDTVRTVPLQEFHDQLAIALRQGWNGFTGQVVEPIEISTPAPAHYRPHRVRVRLLYRHGNFVSVDIEASPEELDELAVIEQVAVIDAEPWFDEVDLPVPAPIPALPLEHQIAQKLHACTAPDEPGWTNDRVHDLVDLQLARDLYAGTLSSIRGTTERLFAYRNRHAWPPTVTSRAGWADRYPQEAVGLDVLPTADEALAWANAFIADIAKA